MLPTPANIKYANRLIAEIRARIKTGAFRMTGYFPDAELAPAQESSTERPPTKAPKTIKAAKATHDRVASPDAPLHDPSPAPAKRRAMKAATELTVEAWLTQWLDMTRIETSTRIGYDAAVKSGRAHRVTSATARWVRCPLCPLSSRTSSPSSPAAANSRADDQQPRLGAAHGARRRGRR